MPKRPIWSTCSRLRALLDASFHRRFAERAIADYDPAIKQNPNAATSFNNRGTAYYFKRDFDRAIADFNEAIRRGRGLIR